MELFSDEFFDSEEASINNITLDDILDDEECPFANTDWFLSLKNSIAPNKFNILHLNVNSIMGPSKLPSIHAVINSDLYDFISFQETKVDSTVPDAMFNFSNYQTIRRDRVKGGGGIIIFIKKNYKIMYNSSDEEFETITLTLKLKNSLVNFIVSYNPHLELAAIILNHYFNESI